ncbi:hypothetical protein Pmi06nite_05030 [Planotetraspora mira]|uniref:Uncharacterized protein n=1 Tax=Planotetraspora mira TaxID=58121 RepID=A0A8J3TJX2_9ACTN|nr:hypothetical protein Pmi06nite_05030 [Planotetraspora mira]
MSALGATSGDLLKRRLAGLRDNLRDNRYGWPLLNGSGLGWLGRHRVRTGVN